MENRKGCLVVRRQCCMGVPAVSYIASYRKRMVFDDVVWSCFSFEFMDYYVDLFVSI